MTRRNEAGFTLLEVLVVVALLGTLAAMAIMVSPAFLKSARGGRGNRAGDGHVAVGSRNGDQSAAERAGCVCRARRHPDDSRGHRRERRRDRNDGAAHGSIRESHAVQGRRGVPNTPALFSLTGATTGGAIAFGTSTTRMFTSEGTFVNQAGRRVERDNFSGDPGRLAQRTRDHDLRSDGPHPRLALERPGVGGVRRWLT